MIRFNNITEDVNRNYSKLNYLDRNIDDLSKNLNDIGLNQQWVINKNYKILNIDKNYKNATIMIFGSLKELENNSKIYLLYTKLNKTNNEDTEWIKKPLEVYYGLKFKKKLVLPYKENYKFKILAEGPNKSKSEELLNIFFKNEMENRIYTHIFANKISKYDNNFSLDISIDNNYKGEKRFKIKNIKINVYNDNQISNTISVYENGSTIRSSLITELPIYDKNNELVDMDDGDIEKLNFSVKIKSRKEFKESNNVKFEVILYDYMGERYKRQYPDANTKL